MAWAKGEEQQVVDQGFKFLAIGPYTWGAGASSAAAIKRAKADVSSAAKRQGYTIMVYKTSPEAYVNDMGGINYKEGETVTEHERIVVRPNPRAR